MNFLDTYDITNSVQPSNQPQASNTGAQEDSQSQTSLNDEVNQVVGQLGRFWGGFRKQSQSAFEAARKDFTEVVGQAQRELSKYTAETSGNERSAASGAQSPPSEGETGPEAGPSSVPQEGASTSAPSSLFSRFQAALPPHIVSTVQQSIPETLRNATENIDINHIQANVLAEFQRVQGVTRAHAGEYVQKSEALFREAMKEAGEVLKDAVKVIPPEEAGSSTRSQSGVFWDGTDMWMLPTETSLDDTTNPAAGSSSKAANGTPRGVATRAEVLYKRLVQDPAILRHDPSVDGAVGEQYRKWYHDHVEAQGGIDGEALQRQIAERLAEDHGEALKETRDILVPAEMTISTFWSHFFFRVHQIQIEEEKRKALLQGSVESEDDFSWEDEEEEPETTQTISDKTPAKPSEMARAQGSMAANNNLARESSTSEDSYDNLSSDEGGDEDEDVDESDDGSNATDGMDSADKKRAQPTAVGSASDSHATKQTAQKADDDSDWE